MSTEASVISWIIKYDGLQKIQMHGIGQDFFHEEWRTVYRYLHRSRRDHGSVPSEDVVLGRFPDIELPKVRKTDLPQLISEINRRKKWIDILETIDESTTKLNSPDDVDDVIQELQGKLNSIGFSGKQKSHLVDLFSAEASMRIRKEMRERKSMENAGIPTGLTSFDAVSGGLHKQRMITVIARSGVGKSWLDLFFVAQAVSAGRKVILYPLEMTLFETAARLYTIFTQMHFGHERVLKNLDLTSGKISTRKIARFTSLLEDKFEGQLIVADVSSLSDPYTVERIEAEVEAHKPDMFWVDYITLLKAPPGSTQSDAGWEQVGRLSKGIKNIAMRRDVVGGASAQVNRTGVNNFNNSKAVMLPRLEQISYGDAIGQDTDQAFSLGKKGNDLYYALVKNRHGPEIGKTRVEFQVNEGILREYAEQEDDDDD